MAARSGHFVDLAGVRAEEMTLSPEIDALVRATPSDYPTVASAYRASPAALRSALAGDPYALINAAFTHGMGREDPLGGEHEATSPQRAGATLGDMLSNHVDLPASTW